MNQKDILEKILHSVFYSNTFKKATRMTNNTTGILGLLSKVLKKTLSAGSGATLQGTKTKILNLAKLLKAYAKGEYRDIEVKNIAIILASFIYFLSPIDLIPDFLPFIGFGDDIALLAFVYNSVSNELEKFEMWDLNKNLG